MIRASIVWCALGVASAAIAFGLLQKWSPSSPPPVMALKAPLQIAAENQPSSQLMFAVDPPVREQVVPQKPSQQLQQHDQIAELLKKIEALEAREKKRQEEEAAKEKAVAEAKAKALNEENDRLRHENEKFKAQEEARRKARTLVRLKIIFKTIRDDKDDQDVVYMSLLSSQGQELVKHQDFGGRKLDNNTEVPTEFRVPAVLVEGLSIKLSKSGTDGWIFHFRVVGEMQDGSLRELHPQSGELHFEDNHQSDGPFALH